jgi:hypothetical protein
MCICCNTIYENILYYIEKSNHILNIIDYNTIDYEIKSQNNLQYTILQKYNYTLQLIEGTEFIHIPSNIIDDITNIKNKKTINITNFDIIRYLKNNNYDEYCIHLSLIKNKLGIKNMLFGENIKQDLLKLFHIICTIKDDDINLERMDLFYIIYKFCELLCMDKYIQNIYLKQNIIKENDIIWKKICTKFNWTFQPTYKYYFDSGDDIDWELVMVSV